MTAIHEAAMRQEIKKAKVVCVNVFGTDDTFEVAITKVEAIALIDRARDQLETHTYPSGQVTIQKYGTYYSGA